jgi:hypothetical protein
MFLNIFLFCYLDFLEVFINYLDIYLYEINKKKLQKEYENLSEYEKIARNGHVVSLIDMDWTILVSLG